MRNTRRFQIIALWLLVASPAAAFPLNHVPPFSGVHSESWESFPLLAQLEQLLPNPSPIMGGFASASSPNATIIDPGHGTGLGPSGFAQIHGQRALRVGGFNGTAAITFDQPVKRFGAYWGALTDAVAGSPANIALSFYDENNALIDAFSFPYVRPGDGLLEWHGWASSTPIKRLTFTEDYMVLDDLQATVPETASLLPLALSALLLLRRAR